MFNATNFKIKGHLHVELQVKQSGCFVIKYYNQLSTAVKSSSQKTSYTLACKWGFFCCQGFFDILFLLCLFPSYCNRYSLHGVGQFCK